MYMKRCGLDGYLIMENTSTSGVSKVGLCHAAPGDSDKRQVSWKTVCSGKLPSLAKVILADPLEFAIQTGKFPEVSTG